MTKAMASEKKLNWVVGIGEGSGQKNGASSCRVREVSKSVL